MIENGIEQRVDSWVSEIVREKGIPNIDEDMKATLHYLTGLHDSLQQHGNSTAHLLYCAYRAGRERGFAEGRMQALLSATENQDALR